MFVFIHKTLPIMILTQTLIGHCSWLCFLSRNLCWTWFKDTFVS